MSKHNYVYSTLSSDNNYTNYHGSENGMHIRAGSVLIRGGSGVARKHLITPMGVVTPVSDEELEVLELNHDFKRHKENGFIRVDKRNVDPEKIVADDMQPEDESAPLSPKDYEENNDDPEVLKVVVDKGKRKAS